MKFKFVKPFSSFKYCMDFNNSTKDMWKMALRDPAYLTIIGICLAMTVYLLTIIL